MILTIIIYYLITMISVAIVLCRICRNDMKNGLMAGLIWPFLGPVVGIMVLSGNGDAIDWEGFPETMHVILIIACVYWSSAMVITSI